MIEDETGIKAIKMPGGQHKLNDEYFKRIEALNFTLEHDDGQNIETITNAEIILVGVSRTSKTPTCIYLANQGIKAANIPLVPNQDLPKFNKNKNPLKITYYNKNGIMKNAISYDCLLYTSPSPRDRQKSRMPSSA